MNNEFKKYHPIISFTYFVLMLVFSCVFMHPVMLGVSIVSAVSHLIILRGSGKAVPLMLPMVLIMALFNPMFNHSGATVLCYLPSGNPLTFESLIYGLAAAVMILSVICRFLCYSEVMTSDKFIYLFGKAAPSLSLVLSMTLRFVPRFRRQLNDVINAQSCVNTYKKGLSSRIRHSAGIMTAMLTWALEGSFTTADSMRARGYGICKRTAFSVYRFDGRDKLMLTAILLLGIYVIIGAVCGAARAVYYPYISWSGVTPYNLSVWCIYMLLAFMPHIIELTEVIRWQAIKSKM